MENQHMRSEGSGGRQLLEDALAALKALDRAMRGHNGSDGILTRLSHVERTADENRERIRGGLASVRSDIERIRNDVDMLVSPGEKLKVQGARLGVVKEGIIVIGVILSLALSIVNIWMGVQGP